MTILAIVLVVLAAYFFALFITYRHRFCLATARDQGFAIQTTPLTALDDRFRLTDKGPTRDAEVTFIGGADAVPAGTTDREAWVLCVLSKDASTIFEFGTATGKTACLMASNSPPDARVITLTLPPGGTGLYEHGEGDSTIARDIAVEESRFDEFLYSGTDAEAKIQQVYDDSKRFDHEPWRDKCDLIFVDGAHAYSYVMSDSRKAFDNGVADRNDHLARLQEAEGRPARGPARARRDRAGTSTSSPRRNAHGRVSAGVGVERARSAPTRGSSPAMRVGGRVR